MDPSKVPVGARSGVHRTYLDPDNVVAYALASNDDNGLYLSGQAVPPLFAVVVAWTAFWDRAPIPPEATEGSSGGVHGEHDLYLRKPMVPGTWLNTVCEISAAVGSNAGLSVFLRLVSTDDEGGEVLDQYWSLMYLGQVEAQILGVPPPDHSFPDVARSRPIGSVKLATTRDQTFRYAGASGDREAMHVDDEVARARGFPRKLNQGLCTLAVASRGLIDLAAGGDPRRVQRVAVRFSSPAFPGDTIDLAVHDAGSCGQDSHGYAFEATSEGQTVLRHGRVEVAES
jgi:acyl dehydratase